MPNIKAATETAQNTNLSGWSLTSSTAEIMQRREEFSNTLLFVGIASTLGGLIGFIAHPSNLVARYALHTGLFLTAAGVILSIGFQNMADFLSEFQNSNKTLSPSTLDSHLSPRKAAIAGALIAAGSIAVLTFPGFQYGGSLLSGHPHAIIGLITGLTIMTLSALLAFLRSDKETDPDSLNAGTSFFNSKSIALSGTLFAGTGVMLMREGIKSPGVNLLLVGIGFVLTEMIITHVISAYDKDRHSYTQKDANRWHKFRYARFYAQPAAAITAMGAGLDIIHKSLSTPAYAPSLKDANMVAFMVGVTMILIAELYAEWQRPTTSEFFGRSCA